MNAIPDHPVTFDLSNGRQIVVTHDRDRDDVTVRVFGPKCGDLLITPAAGNSIRIRPSGDGMPGESTVTCGRCGNVLTKVRPGKHQCDSEFCNGQK